MLGQWGVIVVVLDGAVRLCEEGLARREEGVGTWIVAARLITALGARERGRHSRDHGVRTARDSGAYTRTWPAYDNARPEVGEAARSGVRGRASQSSISSRKTGSEAGGAASARLSALVEGGRRRADWDSVQVTRGS
ncbi:unnamed protein product [Chondrus crispus]|uniref:Uncharacterized protein n=1 Tax=Chondrus crispus TaxID=2769 RepID=R7QPI1_CHOCR|nr:unnamed protein product [Chondrus crispus]CDF39396.1 unnamed protein product [Chondrus crispus]|eukprot:XP_005719307.1 unnamed protein product [Chondrus crispus]